MKMSRRDRKMYNAGKQLGYTDGYIKGLHDGNPFNAMIEAFTNVAKRLDEFITENPEFLEQLNTESLEIEGLEDEE